MLTWPPRPIHISLGQATGVTCEDTPEGGQRCSDGTYHPPGCPLTPGAPGTVQGAPPEAGFPIVPVAIAAGALAVGAGFALLGNRRMLGGEAPGPSISKILKDYPYELELLLGLESNIRRERAADAYSFKLLHEAMQLEYTLIEAVKRWEGHLIEAIRTGRPVTTVHGSQDQQVIENYLALYRNGVISYQEDVAKYRAEIDRGAQKILSYHEDIKYIISTLPVELQITMRRTFSVCR